MVRLFTRDVDYVQMEVCSYFWYFRITNLTRQINLNLANTCVELTNSGHTGVVKQKY